MARTQPVLAEKAMLLMLDERGRRRGAHDSLVAVGAVIASLALGGTLAVEGTKRKRRFVLTPTAERPRHPFEAAVYDAMVAKGLDRSPSSLISHVGHKRGVLEPLFDDMIAKGWIGREKTQVLWIFPKTYYPEANGSAKAEVLARLNHVIFHGMDPAPEDAALISLVRLAGRFKPHFDKADLKLKKERLKEITDAKHPAVAAVKEAIDAINAAVIAATTAASTGAVVSS